MTAASAANFHVVGGELTRDTWHYNYTCAGGEARPGELPWHVSMLRHYEGWHGCSAALLSCDPPIVVTAAHCVESVISQKIFPIVWKNIFSRKTKPSDLKLGFGSHTLDIYRPSPLAAGEQRLEVGEIVRHPRYSAYVARWDT